ncbi:hypothetical protein BH20ACT24_BH20ACT24_02050 [soil metagenome]
MRVLLWHGWLLEGSGSNIYAAKTAEVMRRAGHEVVLLCQEPEPGRFPFVDACGTVSGRGVAGLVATGTEPARGRLVVLRPEIGSLLPVFVIDEYEGFEVKRFVDLGGRELDLYLERNVAALRAVASWHRPEAVVTGHAVPGSVLALRALGAGTYVAKIHGSDLEYAVRRQRRYLELTREGLEGARAVAGASRDVLERTREFVPAVADRLHIVTPGVEIAVFRPGPRTRLLDGAARALEENTDVKRGRPEAVDEAVREALTSRRADRMEELARSYDQAVPDPGAADRLRREAIHEGGLVGYIGKFIPEKGVHLLVEALALAKTAPRAILIGFGLHREWLTALTWALHEGDVGAARWLAASSELDVELSDSEIVAAAGLADRIVFTGRLDHRYAGVVGALDVLVVPSVLDEAFGMVAAEAAAAGAVPLVARHSGLAEVASALEGSVSRPGLLSYDPGPGASRRIAEALDRVLGLPREEIFTLRAAVSGFASREWTWERTAERLLSLAGPAERNGT